MPVFEGSEDDEESGAENESENERERANEDFKTVSSFNILNTNARSITPKIECLMEYLNELNTGVAF